MHVMMWRSHLSISNRPNPRTYVRKYRMGRIDGRIFEYNNDRHDIYARDLRKSVDPYIRGSVFVNAERRGNRKGKIFGKIQFQRQICI